MSGWTPEIAAWAIKHWREGQSASELARGVRASFGVSFTRNAVIGKLHRLGETVRARPERDTQTRKQQNAGRRPCAVKASPPSKPRLVAIESPVARPWAERHRGECRWPIGDQGVIRSCCNPIARGSFCADHASVAYQPTSKASDLARSLRRFM